MKRPQWIIVRLQRPLSLTMAPTAVPSHAEAPYAGALGALSIRHSTEDFLALEWPTVIVRARLAGWAPSSCSAVSRYRVRRPTSEVEWTEEFP